MNGINNLFLEDGWIVAKNIDGKIKVTSAQNDTCNFDRTRDNWLTFRKCSFSQDGDDGEEIKTNQLKEPYREIASKNTLTGFLLIRDLLNLKKTNDLSDVFLVDGVQVHSVALCAKITSVKFKDNYYRLIVEDGTSAILCVVKRQQEESNSREDETNDHSLWNQSSDNSPTAYLLEELNSFEHKITGDMSADFDHSSLGAPLMINGFLNEFEGRNFIFAYTVRWVTENYFVKFLEFIVQGYRFKKNYMLE